MYKVDQQDKLVRLAFRHAGLQAIKNLPGVKEEEDILEEGLCAAPLASLCSLLQSAGTWKLPAHIPFCAACALSSKAIYSLEYCLQFGGSPCLIEAQQDSGVHSFCPHQSASHITSNPAP